jgi:hypothetical protein
MLGIISYKALKIRTLEMEEIILWIICFIALAINIGKYSEIHLIISIITCITLIILQNTLKKSSEILASISNNSYHFFLVHGVGIAIGSIGLAYININQYSFIVTSFIASLLLAYALQFFSKIKFPFMAILFIMSLAALYFSKNPTGIYKYDNAIYGGESHNNSDRKVDKNTIYAYGDSHAAMIRHGMQNLSNSNFQNLKSDSELAKLSKHTPIIVSFRWIGFDKWIKNHNINTENPESIAQGYASWLKNTLKDKSNILIIGAYPEINKFLPSPFNNNCLNAEHSTLIYINNGEYIQEFNNAFEIEVLKLGFKFLNPLNRLTDSKNTLINECYFFDNNHLSTLGSRIIANDIFTSIKPN